MFLKKNNKDDEKRHISFIFSEKNGVANLDMLVTLTDDEIKEFIDMCSSPDLMAKTVIAYLDKKGRGDLAAELEVRYLKNMETLLNNSKEELYNVIMEEASKREKRSVKTDKVLTKVFLNDDLNIEPAFILKEDIKNRVIIWEDLNIHTDISDGIIKEIEDSEELADFDELLENINQEEIITSPFGLFKVKDFFNPMGQYNWHMAHTNFTITDKILKSILIVAGIEKVLILSRYRLLIAFGKAFEDKKIKKALQEILNASPPLSPEALAKANDLAAIYKRWAIYYRSDQWQYATEDEYDEKIQEFRKNQQDFGGIVVTHED